ncbi:MAG: PAS domain S-box protein [FCB group bacterium]|jgi:PAS domain S-box-containing protein|nr:PAS domain S-box protein [FCB group bacterium]
MNSFELPETYRQAVSQSGDAVLIVDSNCVIQYVNAAFEKITGYSADEVLGKHPSILKSGKHDRAFYQSLWETPNEGRTFRGVFLNRHKNGLLFHEK